MKKWLKNFFSVPAYPQVHGEGECDVVLNMNYKTFMNKLRNRDLIVIDRIYNCQLCSYTNNRIALINIKPKLADDEVQLYNVIRFEVIELEPGLIHVKAYDTPKKELESN